MDFNGELPDGNGTVFLSTIMVIFSSTTLSSKTLTAGASGLKRLRVAS
jgi:hypothetical protein